MTTENADSAEQDEMVIVIAGGDGQKDDIEAIQKAIDRMRAYTRQGAR